MTKDKTFHDPKHAETTLCRHAYGKRILSMDGCSAAPWIDEVLLAIAKIRQLITIA